jgi:hypothetical protein
MVVSLLVTIVLLMALMIGWIEVQRMARRVADEHPEAGPLRLVGGGCGGHNHGEPPAAPAKPKTPSAEGCAACDNVACKPGDPQKLSH